MLKDTYNESELLGRLASGNEAAFTEIFHRYHQLLATYVYRLTRSQELTEEVVQDVFLKIWLNREAIFKIQEFKAYLFAAARNHAFNALKKASLDSVYLEDNEWSYHANRLVETGENETDYGKLIDEAIDLLPPQQQRVYLLSKHERRKYNQIAQELNLSTETVKKYIQLSSESIRTYVQKKARGSIASIFLYFF